MQNQLQEEIDYSTIHLVHLGDLLEVKYEQLTLMNRRSKEFKSSKEEYNKLVKLYNSRRNDQIFAIYK